MAKSEHLAILKDALAQRNIEIWNRWHLEYKAYNYSPMTYANLWRAELSGEDLSRASLYEAYLREANLSEAKLNGTLLYNADLREANLRGADLGEANLEGANLRNADLSKANLSEANLSKANLYSAKLDDAKITSANLRGANLQLADLSQADLAEADLRGTTFDETLLINTKFVKAAIGSDVVHRIGKTRFIHTALDRAEGLQTVYHVGPSSIDTSTFYISGGNIPEVFLRGCGVPETMITFAKSLVGKPIQYDSAFISYSSQDEHFARRLHSDLQMNGVRVWFAPDDLKTGDVIEDSIDQAIRIYDKLILVLSQNSIERAWVRKEFSKAIEKEKQHGKTVLFPIRLDDSVFETSEQWAYDIRKRHIGDFRNWTNPLLYQNAINRLLRDLNAEN